MLQKVMQTSALLWLLQAVTSTHRCVGQRNAVCPENRQVRALTQWKHEDCFVPVYL